MHLKNFLTIIYLVFTFVTQAQSPNGTIVIGKTDSVYSKILKENRKIWVYVPNQASGDPLKGSQRFPVVYLLDGDAHFHSVTGMIQQQSQVNGNTEMPEMIVVGIPNTDRFRDLTPTHTDKQPFPGTSPPNAGGGEDFLAFIEKELMPHIDSAYPTAPYKVMIGHSLGGLMAIHALIHHPAMFNAYIAIDPSLWWHDQKLLKESTSVLRSGTYMGKSLFLGMANTLPEGMDTLRMKKDTSNKSIHPRSIFAFRDVLRKGPTNGLAWSARYYPEDDHGSVPLMSEYDGLRFIFRSYRITFMNKLGDSTFDFCGNLSAHFKKLSAEMGYPVKPPEGGVNSLGYFYIEQKNYKQARCLFTQNIANFPGSANGYDSMGDLYAAQGDKAKAIEYFEKALGIQESADTRGKLDKLKGK
jgi:uncharacterized protein